MISLMSEVVGRGSDGRYCVSVLAPELGILDTYLQALCHCCMVDGQVQERTHDASDVESAANSRTTIRIKHLHDLAGGQIVRGNFHLKQN